MNKTRVTLAALALSIAGALSFAGTAHAATARPVIQFTVDASVPAYFPVAKAVAKVGSYTHSRLVRVTKCNSAAAFCVIVRAGDLPDNTLAESEGLNHYDAAPTHITIDVAALNRRSYYRTAEARYTVVLHEVSHTLGLVHTGDCGAHKTTNLMNMYLSCGTKLNAGKFTAAQIAEFARN